VTDKGIQFLLDVTKGENKRPLMKYFPIMASIQYYASTFAFIGTTLLVRTPPWFLVRCAQKTLERLGGALPSSAWKRWRIG
jgi:hypothetical protein